MRSETLPGRGRLIRTMTTEAAVPERPGRRPWRRHAERRPNLSARDRSAGLPVHIALFRGPDDPADREG